MVQKIYLEKQGGTKTSQRDNKFTAYEEKIYDVAKGLPAYEEFTPEEIKISAEADLTQDIPEKKTGKGFNRRFHRCLSIILSDISRLEVLGGGKRAGDNSPEITNEAADICRRLFQGNVMDIHTYREFIDELVENHGYHSD